MKLLNILEEQRSGCQEGRLFNAAKQLGSEAAKKLEERRAGWQEGFSEGRKLRGQEGKLVNSGKCKVESGKLNNFQFSTFSFQLKQKAAFTLAEVLITLAVIGVVAAMTLPTLIQNYKKTVYVNQLKKSYSMWEQAFQKMMADDGVQKLSDTSVWASKGNSDCSATRWTTDTNCRNFVTNIGKYLKIIKDYDINKVQFKYLGSNSYNTWTNPHVFYLSDGTEVYLDIDSSPDTRSIEECNEIKSLGGNVCSSDGSMLIDVNGKKGPNTYGRDLFIFYFSDEGRLYPSGGKDNMLMGGMELLYWRNDDSDECGTPDSGEIANVSGTGCAARIMENGWKMDY